MGVFTWDPDRYLTYAGERGRPFLELVARVDADTPRRVVDLGCGPGNLTGLLAQRWPEAEVIGVDSSPEMVEAARALDDSLTYQVGDVVDWDVEPGSVDVLVSNAMLQWVPGHLDLLPRLLEAVAPGGWFAFQVPGNVDEPSHTLRSALAAEPAYADRTRDVATPDAHDAATYLDALQPLVASVDAWETTYLHVLTGADPVFAWVSGTGARPTLEALGPDLRPAFEDELKARLRAAYPDTGQGVVLPFRRVFCVARKAA